VMSKFPYSIGYWNVRGVKGKLEEVSVLAGWLDVIGLAETKLLPGEGLDLPGFCVYGDGMEPGVLLGVRYLVPHRPLQLTECGGLSAVGIQVWSGGQWISVVAMYASGGFSAHDWEVWLTSVPQPMLLAGDLNAHHPMWGGVRMNRKGTVVAASLEDHGLVVLNDGTTTFVRWWGGVLQESVLDLVLCSSCMAGDLRMVVSDDLRGSDHLPIAVGAGGSVFGLGSTLWAGEGSRNRRRGLRKVVSGAFGKFLQDWGLGRQVQRPRRLGCGGNRTPPWWTPDCTKAVRDRRHGYRRFQRFQSEERWVAYCAIAAKSKQVIRCAKRSFGSRLCQSVSRGMSGSKVWSLLSGARATHVTWVFSQDGQTVLRGLSLAEAFADHFYSVYTGPSGVPCAGGSFGKVVGSSNDEPFSLLELEAALSVCREGAPGVDGVRYSHLRGLNADAKQELLTLFNAVWNGQGVPEAWKFAVVTPVPRAGKERFLLASYRPISLLSCVGKLFERMVIARLQWYVEQEGVLHRAQFGFRRHRNAQDAVLFLESGIREAWLQGSVVLAVFLDVRAAYDTVVHCWLFQALSGMGISSKLAECLRAMVSDRVFVTRVGGWFSAPRRMNRGLPQGSCLSPLLFVVFLNSLLCAVAPHANVAAFADDVAIWLVGPCVEDLVQAMQAVIRFVEGWLTDRGMSLSPGKSQVVLFARGAVPEVTVEIGGVPVRNVKEVRYLGVILDAALTFTSEVQSLKRKVEQDSRMLACLSGDPYMGKRSVLRNFFLCYVQAKCDFHLPFLCQSAVALRTLQVVVNGCLRLLTGCLRSTSIAALHVEAGCTPLEWRARGLLLRLVLRCLGRGRGDLVGDILLDYCGLGMREWRGLGSAGLGVQMYKATVLPGFHLRLPWIPVAPWVLGNTLAGCVQEEFVGDGLQIYCDASFQPGLWKGGVGVSVPALKLGYAWRLPAVPSVFISELVAISLACDVGGTLGAREIVVLSDSLAGVRFLSAKFARGDFTHPLVCSIGLRVAEALRSGTYVTISWVRGHTGIVGNETADQLARGNWAGLASRVNEVAVFVSAKDLGPVVKSIVEEWWEDSWIGDDKGRDLFSLHPSVARPVGLDSFAKRDASLLSRLRTGHVWLNSKAFELGFVRSPLCACKLAWETVSHFLLDCPLYVEHRVRLRAAVGRELTLGVLLGVKPHALGGCQRSLRAVLRFCHETNRFV